MAIDPESEAHRVPAGNRAMFAHAVRVLDLPQMSARLPMNCVHEKLLCLLAVFPPHMNTPIDKPRNSDAPAKDADYPTNRASRK
jgi:hypothetical protein